MRMGVRRSERWFGLAVNYSVSISRSDFIVDTRLINSSWIHAGVCRSQLYFVF